MNRPTLTPAIIEQAFALVRAGFDRRLTKHGNGALVSPHEVLGVIVEEHHELVEAVQSNDAAAVESESIDVAVACIVGIASMAAVRAAADAPSDSDPRGPTGHACACNGERCAPACRIPDRSRLAAAASESGGR